MNILTDIVPSKYRKLVYALLTLASLVFTAWQAADGDWSQFAYGIVVALIGATATSNTSASDSGE